MARLPDPITDRLMVEWQEKSAYEVSNKNFFSMLGLSVRNANRETLKKAEPQNKGDDDKNESN